MPALLNEKYFKQSTPHLNADTDSQEEAKKKSQNKGKHKTNTYLGLKVRKTKISPKNNKTHTLAQ